MIFGPVDRRSMLNCTLRVCLIGVICVLTPAVAFAQAAKQPTLSGPFKSADTMNDTAPLAAVTVPELTYLHVSLDQNPMVDGNLVVTVGKTKLNPIRLSRVHGTEQRVAIDSRLLESGQQDITATWDPDPLPPVAPAAAVDLTVSPASNSITVLIKKTVFTPAKAPQLGTLIDAATKMSMTGIASNAKNGILSVTFTDSGMTTGILQVYVGTERTITLPVTDTTTKTQTFNLDFTGLSMTKSQDVTAVWDPTGDGDGLMPSPLSNALTVNVDTVAPVITGVKLSGIPGGAANLQITFAGNDLSRVISTDATSPQNPKNYVLNRAAGQASFGQNFPTPASVALSPAGDAVTMTLENLITDTYQITISNIVDSHGNAIDPNPQSFKFSSLPDPDASPHVAFPEYTVRPERNKKELFNPGDKVETRVARLYYFRDAHRVAQIINRNVKSYNRAAVTMAQQNAEDSRTLANQKTADRKQKEASAIRAAEATRAAEQELAAARQTLEDIRAVNAQAAQGAAAATRAATQLTRQQSTPDMEALQRQIDDLTTQITNLKTSIDNDTMTVHTSDTTIAGLDDDITDLQAKIDAFGPDATTKMMLDDKTKTRTVAVAKRKNVLDRLNTQKAAREAAISQQDKLKARQVALTTDSDDLRAQSTDLSNRAAIARTATSEFVAKVGAAEAKVASLREVERNKQEEINFAQEAEDRARENQFRAEVAAASTDPDTYVPADVKSADPVTQVSVSVIGEGLIQLRGPIRGINKIRTMINQIDSPVGQVKVGIFTVQVNGEHGDRMEKVAARIEGNIDLSRFLTNQSLGLLRRAIQEVAGLVVKNVDIECRGNRQLDRDRRYLYGFFGRDFIDELYEMDSEFLHTENKLLSLHSMDTVSQSQAFFILSLAKNDVRQMILERFRYLIQAEMPCAEWDYRRSASMTRKIDHQKINTLKEVTENVYKKYHFSNLHGFFNAWVDYTDAMTPMQREFIRLAQIFKSQMVAEMEYKQRVIERGLIEDQANDEDEFNIRVQGVRDMAQTEVVNSLADLVRAQKELTDFVVSTQKTINDVNSYTQLLASYKPGAEDPRWVAAYNTWSSLDRIKSTDAKGNVLPAPLLSAVSSHINYFQTVLADVLSKDKLLPGDSVTFLTNFVNLQKSRPIDKNTTYEQAWNSLSQYLIILGGTAPYKELAALDAAIAYANTAASLTPSVRRFLKAANNPTTSVTELEAAFSSLNSDIDKKYPASNFPNGGYPQYIKDLRAASDNAYMRIAGSESSVARSKSMARRLRRDIDHRKLLEFLTDEQEEKYIELEEGCRSHISQIDSYLKRLAIALEDDFKVQFYDPAFAEVRRASREWDVNLGQVERTTILTNNRALAKVSPQATMEFDLPKRDIMITEAMNGARALVNEYGNLMQDPTFLSATAMLSGSPAVGGVGGRSPISGLPGQGLGAGGVRNVLPGQSTDATEQLMAQTGGPSRTFGSEFEKLIPDPAVYKIETGTGFEIRPVIQPDGHSIIYDFDYMYTTNIREPVRPDEKHLGRVKRHFIHTEVQTSSFELREISRYQVALKVSRTSRGVPLMEDIPGVGILFRPLPSAESALQQNIILGQSTVYPTLFDLMGLRWSKHVVDIDHVGLRDLEHVIRGRNTTIHDFTFDEGARRVDEFLDIESKEKGLYRPDLYRQQRQPSPYHPAGYHNSRIKDERDPTGHGFNRPDTRPEDFREPAFDPKFRGPLDQAPIRGPRPEVINIGPASDYPAIQQPPNSGFSTPVPRTTPEEVDIRQMKYEKAVAKATVATPNVANDHRNASKKQASSAKPQMLNLPTFGSRKK